MSKNIIILSDGTGQDGEKDQSTNVHRLFLALENKTSKQFVFYQEGIAAKGLLPVKFWRTITGFGIGKHIRECYKEIVQEFEIGDNLYFFGFSRGAATVRSLSGFIELFGVLPKNRPDLIKKAYKIYKRTNLIKRARAAKKFTEQYSTTWTRVKFLGVWDTVTVLGLPIKPLSDILHYFPALKYKFHNFSLSSSVENAYQALSIDDERKRYHPILWNEKINSGQKIEQVWFCGDHSDVGGGHLKGNLANIPLKWMVENAVAQNLILNNDDLLSLPSDPNEHLHTTFNLWNQYKIRAWPEKDDNGEPRGKPNIHPSVFQRTQGKNNSNIQPYEPWIFYHVK